MVSHLGWSTQFFQMPLWFSHTEWTFVLQSWKHIILYLFSSLAVMIIEKSSGSSWTTLTLGPLSISCRSILTALQIFQQGELPCSKVCSSLQRLFPVILTICARVQSLHFTAKTHPFTHPLNGQDTLSK